MYKAKHGESLDKKCLHFSSYLQGYVQSYYTGSFNNFEVSYTNDNLKVDWQHNLSSYQQKRIVNENTIKLLISDSTYYNSSFNIDGVTLETSSFSSQSLYNLENDLFDETIKCVGYANSGSLTKGGIKKQTEISRGLVNIFNNGIEEIDISIENDILNTDIFINTSSIDLNQVQEFCTLNSLETGSINTYDVSNIQTYSSNYNHHIEFYSKGISDKSENIFGKSKFFVSHYGNILARKLALNEVKEKVITECTVEILFVEGNQTPSYIKYNSDGVEYTKDISLFTKEYILQSYGINDYTVSLFNDAKYFN